MNFSNFRTLEKKETQMKRLKEQLFKLEVNMTDKV